MYQLATTSVSVLRGTTTNIYSDVIDTGAVYRTGIPAYLDEQVTTVSDPSSQTPRIVRTSTCVMPFATDVTESDQILDERTGITYSIHARVNTHIPGRDSDVQLILRNVT